MVRLTEEAIKAGLIAAKRLREGELPTEAELASAPVLIGWVLVEEPGKIVCLGGFVKGHPILADGWVWTSVLLFMEPNRQWARTVSRLYRLADPATPQGE